MKLFFRCLSRWILNNIINIIPSWSIRKILYRLYGIKIGHGSRIMIHVIIFHPQEVTIGCGSIVNSYALLDGRGGLVIGNNVNISMYAILYSASHKSYSPSFEYYTSKTIIEDCCWIGTRSIVMPGSIVRRNSIIAVNSTFKGISENAGIYVGVPAKFLKYRDLKSDYDSELRHHYWFE